MSSNTPPGFEDPAFLEDLLYSEIDETDETDETDDRFLIDELPHIEHLNTEPKEFEQS